jgi:hypothetical protein
MRPLLTYRKLFKIVLILCFVPVIILYHSCKPELIPSYIHIDSIALHTSPLADGSNSHLIPDAWVYMDNQLVGAFELPATVPLPYSGNHTLEVLAGIKENGVGASRQAYPFYTTYSQPITLLQGGRQTVKPLVAYETNCEPMAWREDFESAGYSVIDTLNTDLRFVMDTVHPFEGHRSLMVTMTASNQQHFQCQSSIDFYRPAIAPEVYLEVNYKCNNKFYVGLINSTNYNSIPYLSFNPTATWNKIYVRLTDVLQGIAIGGPFKIYFGMDRDPLVPTPQMEIDNIKLIY